MDGQNNGRIFAAELVGTAVLLIGGPGTAILAGDAVGPLGAAVAFGLSLLIMTYVIGPISGCHINPAVTLGLFIARKIDAAHALFAVAGQIIGGIGGAAIVYGIASGQDGFQRGQFGSSLWTRGDRYFGLGSTIVVEVVLTALLVMVVLFTATRTVTSTGARSLGGAVAGLTFTLIYLISIPVDNGSANPIRSLATALFADQKTKALEQVWAFVVFPLLGAVVGVIVFLVLDETRLEDTMLVEVPGLVEARDRVEIGGGEIVHGVEDTLGVDGDPAPGGELPPPTMPPPTSPSASRDPS